MKRAEILSRGCRRAIAKRALRGSWSDEKRRVKRGGKRRRQGRWCKSIWQGKSVLFRLAAPPVMALHPGDRNETLIFLSTLRDRSRTPGVELFIDFSRLTSLTPAGCVLLIAEIDRALADQKTIIRARRANHPIIHQVLEQVGIYQKLGVHCDVTPSHDTVIHWQIASGVLTEGQAGGTLLDNYDGRIAEGIRKGLYAGLIEAMTNTVHHAYIDEAGDKLRKYIGKRWWLLSQEKGDSLIVAICDLGIGIPHSLPRSKTFSQSVIQTVWQKLGLDRSDASAIQVALEMGKTRTRLHNRGKGLSDIVEAVDLSPEGGVYLGSYKGVFTCHKGKHNAVNATRPIRGTLVHWTVPIVTSGE